MAAHRPDPIFLMFPLLVTLLASCAAPPLPPPPENMLAYTVSSEGQLADNAPIVVLEHPENDYNRIGSPIIAQNDNGIPHVTIDPNLPSIFAEERSWQGKRGRYTNRIYRVHFSEVPLTLIPFHLTAGKNVGLLIIVTLNDKKQPVLVTTLHTCGCYLAFVPTSFLDPDTFPAGWNLKEQDVFGEILPGLLQYDDRPELQKLHVLLRDGVHRVMAIRLEDAAALEQYQAETAMLQPMDSLSRLQTAAGETFSFFETEGSRKDYVFGSQKIWERLMISWWAFDWRVGEDKRLGRDSSDGPIFYTSLKPWARQASDLRDFAAFLDYWGWGL